MRELTKAQEEIMHLIWDLGRCTVGDIRNEIEKRTGSKPPHSTISTLTLALNEAGYLKTEKYGRTWVYEPAIKREDYGQSSLQKLISKFFGNSPQKMLAHLIKREDLSLEEINDLMKKIEEE